MAKIKFLNGEQNFDFIRLFNCSSPRDTCLAVFTNHDRRFGRRQPQNEEFPVAKTKRLKSPVSVIRDARADICDNDPLGVAGNVAKQTRGEFWMQEQQANRKKRYSNPNSRANLPEGLNVPDAVCLPGPRMGRGALHTIREEDYPV